uniref:Uncharacterized protein n=2 Tax=Meloidogyne TaxID=189290 RepID=A0A6V7TXT6_MELEN|nr:unnamed protein product [Meloidogyne enterolobii]
MAKFFLIFILLIFIFINSSYASSSGYVGNWRKHTPQEIAEAEAKKAAKKEQELREMRERAAKAEKKKREKKNGSTN